MNRYTVHERLGNGAFGEVLKATSRSSGEIVAIKKMKRRFATWEECLQLRELKSLKILHHPNIVRLLEVIRDQEELYFVFEYMESNLYKHIYQNVKAFSEDHICTIMYQLFSALAFTHKHGFFHRDIKPENLLFDGEKIKLADFGQAREVRSRPPYTEYVSTRWYRAPEVLLRSRHYNSPIDIWACGCIMAELYIGETLFPGTSEADQLFKIYSILGHPTQETWQEGVQLTSLIKYRLPKCAPTPLNQIIPDASSASIQLMNELFRYDPSKRITAMQALKHAFFDNIRDRDVAGTKPAMLGTVNSSKMIDFNKPLILNGDGVPNDISLTPRTTALLINRDDEVYRFDKESLRIKEGSRLNREEELQKADKDVRRVSQTDASTRTDRKRHSHIGSVVQNELKTDWSAPEKSSGKVLGAATGESIESEVTDRSINEDVLQSLLDEVMI